MAINNEDDLNDGIGGYGRIVRELARGLRHPYSWSRNHPFVADGLIALAVTAIGVATELAPGEGPGEFRDATWYSLALSSVPTLLLVLRRRFPFTVYLVALLVTMVHGGSQFSGGGPFFAMVVGLYAVAAYTPHRVRAGACLGAALALMAVVGIFSFEDVEVVELVAGGGMFVAAWVLGDNLRIRRAYVVAVEERAAQLEREQDAHAERAVIEERARIARELHDIVAHSMSVMVVQAGAARRVMNRHPDRSVEAIGQIEETGRNALDEMRRLVGVLRSNQDVPATEPERASLGPQPGIAQVPELIAWSQEAGLDVTYRVEGAPREVASGLQLVVYRVVQEALTNVRRHAGPAVRAHVTLTYGKRALALQVVDDGRGAAAPLPAVPGARGRHGLGGMIERVTLYNGEMKWGPRRGGGFRVWVRLPLTYAALGGEEYV